MCKSKVFPVVTDALGAVTRKRADSRHNIGDLCLEAEVADKEILPMAGQSWT